jgi:hypothetical protein
VTYQRSVVLTSPDGLHWTETGAVTGPYASGIGGAIAWDGHTYVALGSEQGGGYYGALLNGAAWTSTDLRTWTKAPDQQGLAGAEEWNGLASGPDGFVAIGYAQGGSTVWVSPDGLHWSALVDDAAFPPESAEPSDIVATSTGFLVVGRIDQQAAAWSSTDGHHWTAYGPFPGGTGVFLDGLVRHGDGWLSLGIGGPATVVAPSLYEEPAAGWISSDGRQWQASPPSPALLGLYGGVVAVPGGYVAAGTVGTGVAVFVSADGLVWSADLPTGTAGSPGARLVSDGRHVLLSTGGPAGSGLWVTSGVTP